MKSMFKKGFSCLVAASLVLTAAGCSNDSQTPQKTETGEDIVTLNVWHQWTEGNDLGPGYDEAVAKFEAENPTIKINTEVLSTDAYKTKIQTEFSGSASGIDVFYYWGEGKAKQLVDANKLLPLNDYLTDDILGKIKPGAIDAFTFDEKIYSLPTFGWYMTLFCNQELFDQAGAKIPTTYEELVTAVEKLSVLDGITPFASGAKDGWNAAFIYEALALREVGAENINKMLSGELPFDDAGYVEAGNKVVELYNMGAFGKNPLEGASTDADALMFGGKGAMRLMGSWFANAVYTDKSSVVQDKIV
ncbi:MAG: ABC transporter substrate-binding protein, partial [Turicibacter sp.]